MHTNGNGSNVGHSRLARGLGWFSIGLGVAEVLAPDRLAKMIGVPRHRALMRTLGFREIASGVAILAQRKPAPGLWSRVGGDAMDLALLGAAMRSDRSSKSRIAGAVAAVAGVTALDVICSRQVSGGKQAIRVERSVTIDRTPADLYAFWHNFEQLPQFMNHLKAVTVTGENLTHWVAKGPMNSDVEWDAETINDRPGELIAWKSIEGSDIYTAGSVRFQPAPGNRGTMVRVTFEYDPPAGKLGAVIAKLFGEDPAKQVNVDLRRFKQLMETGEIARTEGQSAGRASSTSKRFDDFVRK
ncbi:MAG TPA: SRPBCC family protein [Verrucomicrobiae bacterium]|nr:SRPBCC family protein [Verrucomicrobiae bacterium]